MYSLSDRPCAYGKVNRNENLQARKDDKHFAQIFYVICRNSRDMIDHPFLHFCYLLSVFFLFFLIRNKNIFINRVKLKRMRNPSLITNLIKTKEKKKEKEDVKMSQHYYFNTFELHIEIQLS